MLRISKRSLHYRLWKFAHPASEPKNLCRYFWFCVFAVVAPLVIVALVLFAIGALVYVVGTNLTVSGIVVSLVIIGIAAAFGLVKLIQWQGRNVVYGIATSVSSVRPKNREPGLIRSFLRAKKKKVCPMIEVVD